MTLVLHDLLPRFGGGYRGARPGAIAAAVERVILEKMLSVGLTAQARMMRNGPAQAAEGWSPAEDGAYKAARALNMLATASAKLAKTFHDDTRFNDDRQYGEITPEPRLETLAQQAIFSTDRHALKNTLDARAGEETFQEQVWQAVHANARENHAYLEATIERLRLYEPDWLTLEQHKAALEAAGEAAKTRSGARPPDEPAHPDRDRTYAQKRRAEIAAHSKAQIEKSKAAREAKEAAAEAAIGENAEIEKTAKRVVVAEASPATTSSATPPPRKRGAQAGNVLSLKTGRHTAAAKAERAGDSAMLKDVRDFCSDVERFIADEEAKADADAREEATLEAGTG